MHVASTGAQGDLNRPAFPPRVPCRLVFWTLSYPFREQSIKSVSLQDAETQGVGNEFVASNGWLYSCTARGDIEHARLPGVAGSVHRKAHCITQVTRLRGPFTSAQQTEPSTSTSPACAQGFNRV